MKIFHPLATSTWATEEIEAINRVINSGNYSMGNEVAKYEDKFSKFVGSKFAIMVNSGSSANLLMIASLFYVGNKKSRLRAGDEVIVPAISWATTYYPLYQYGLKIKFVDVDLHTLNYKISALKDAITLKTKVVLAVNLLGNPNDFDEINNLIEGRNIILLEDNCESLGAKIDNKYAGTFGLMGTFSSFFSHHISTMEGGVIVTDNEELYQIMLSLRAHGWTRNLPETNLVSGKKSSDIFEESWNFVLPGYNLRPIEMEGAVGIEQLKKLPSFLETRLENAKYFKKKFLNNENFITQSQIGQSSWFGFSLLITKKCRLTRKEILFKLGKSGVETRPIVSGNFARKQVVKYFDYEISGNLDNADYIDSNGFFIGNHHYQINDLIDEVAIILNLGA